MNTTNFDYIEFLSYIKKALDDYPHEVQRALIEIDKYKCSVLSISCDIKYAIDDAIRDYCSDYNIDFYSFNEEEVFDKTIDDIFFDSIFNIE